MASVRHDFFCSLLCFPLPPLWVFPFPALPGTPLIIATLHTQPHTIKLIPRDDLILSLSLSFSLSLSLSLSVVWAHGTLTHFNEWKGLHFIPFASGFHSPKRSQNEHRVCEVVKRTQTINKTPRLGERVINSPLRGFFFIFVFFFFHRSYVSVRCAILQWKSQPTNGSGGEGK